MIRNAQEIARLLLAIQNGQVDVINDRCVLNDHGYFIVEGTKNKRLSWNNAAERLAKVRA